MYVVPLRPDQSPLLVDHLLRLDAGDRSLRFMGALHDSAVREHVARFDWQTGKVVGLWADGALRGAAELRFATAGGGSHAEVALTVETAWQRQGAGTRLLRRAIVIARNRSAVELRLDSFGENHRLQHLARKFGARLTFGEGEVEAIIGVGAPDYFSLRDELFAEWAGGLQACLSPWVSAREPAYAG